MPLEYAHGILPKLPPPEVTVIPGSGQFVSYGNPEPPTVTYIIDVTNNTLEAVSDVSLTLTFPEEVVVHSATFSTGEWSEPTWTISSISGETSGQITIVCNVTAPITSPTQLEVELVGGTDITYSVSTIEALDAANGGTISLYLSGENRAGYTLVSDPVEVIFSPGDLIRVSVPEAARTAVTDFHFYHLGIGEGAVRIARWRSYNDNGTYRTLYPVDLYKDEHLESAPSVSTPSDLPEGENKVEGMTRYVVSEGLYYIYDSLAKDNYIVDGEGGRWAVADGVPTLASVVNVYGAGGCAQPANQIDSSIVLGIEYEPGSDLPVRQDVPLKLYFRATETIPKGTSLKLSVYLNETLKNNLFKNQLIVVFKGFVNLSDGTLDISNPESPSGSMEVDVDVYFDPSKTQFVLEKTLEVGYAAFYEIYLYASNAGLQGLGVNNSEIFIDLRPFPVAGSPAAGYELTGDVVYAAGDYARVLPGNAANKVEIQSGHWVAKGLTFPFSNTEKQVYGLPSSSETRITVTGDGQAFARLNGQTLLPNEVIRAFVTLGEGVSKISWSEPIELTSNGGIEATINHPYDSIREKALVRLDYPDKVAGMWGHFNPSYNRIFLDNGTAIYQLADDVMVNVAESQTIQVTSLVDAATVLEPDPADDVSLYVPDSVEVSTLEVGSLPARTYRIGVGYFYTSNQVLKISHDTARGCIPEIEKTLFEIAEDSSYWLAARTPSTLKQIRSDSLKPFAELKLKDAGSPWKRVIWDPISTEYPDDISVFIPDDLNIQVEGEFVYPGRWVVDETYSPDYWKAPTTLAALQAMASTQITDFEVRNVPNSNNTKYSTFVYIPESVKPPSPSVVVPSDLMSGDTRIAPGAWEKVKGFDYGAAIAIASAMAE